MKFEEVLPALRAGRRIRRECWLRGEYIEFCKSGNKTNYLVEEDERTYFLQLPAANATDWLVCDETDAEKAAKWDKAVKAWRSERDVDGFSCAFDAILAGKV